MKRPGRIIRTNLEDLLIKCKYNANGCGKVDRLGRIERHEQEECTYNSEIKKCGNPICPNKDLASNMILFSAADCNDQAEIYICSLKCSVTL